MDTIKRLEIDISLPSDTPQTSAMDMADKCVKEYFINAVESAVSHFSDEEAIIRKIEVDLGSIDPSDIPYRLESALIESIDMHVQRVRMNRLPSSEENAALSVRDFFKDAASSEDLSAYTFEEALVFSFAGYLENGYSDFSILGRTYDTTEVGRLVAQICMTDNHSLEVLANAVSTHFPESFYRLENSLNINTLSLLVSKIVGLYFTNDSIIVSNDFTNYTVSELRSANLLLDEITRNPKVSDDDKFLVLQAATALVADNVAHSFSFAADYFKETVRLIRSRADVSTESANDGSQVDNESKHEYIRLKRLLVQALPFQSADGLFSELAIRIAHNESFDDIIDEMLLRHGPLPDYLLQKADIRLDNRMHTNDAGLVILHPFFRSIFYRLGLIDETDCFTSLENRIRAAHILKCIVDGHDTEHDDNDMLFCKLLCGLPAGMPILEEFVIKEIEKEEIDALLESVIKYWNPLKSKSAESLRMFFLKRNGTIEKDASGFIVRVAGSAADILMEDLPWEISMIFLPWSEPFFVEWQKES